MIHRIEHVIRRVRRFLSRSEWAARLLNLPLSPETANEPGLVLIQFDGLSAAQAERAMKGGRLPFLKHLLKDEGYRFVRMYSGVPSTTPAVQAEILYGVKQAVPAFSFLDRETGRIVRMYEREAAAEIEKRLSDHEGLACGGAAYSDIYTAGAADPRCCAASGSISDLFRTARPWAIPFLIVINVVAIARMLFRGAVELFLSIGGVIRGIRAGYNPWAEAKMAVSRIFVCILLRHLITIFAKVDIARGVPIIHMNFLGYDEQAHRRGPSSRFAHWTLRGIDESIGSLVKAAHRSSGRDYDVWVYSDHGQEECHSYASRYDITVQDAIGRIFDKLGIGSHPLSEPSYGVQTQRTAVFSRWVEEKKKKIEGSSGDLYEPDKVLVTAMGPLGYVYTPRPLTAEEREDVAERMVHEASVPMVLAVDGEGGVDVWNKHGKWHLPEDAGQLFGEEHPYLEAVTEDFVKLCHHKNAGEFIISGWQLGAMPISFPVETGAHAGPGPAETDAFVIIPGDVKLRAYDGGPFRPSDLRKAALRHLGRDSIEIAGERPPRNVPERCRVMTYNVHSCIGMDGKLSPDRIARVIDLYEPDIVALQELDVGRLRTSSVDQAHVIAKKLEMDFHFHPVIHVEEERYGDAILTHLPVRLIRAEQFASVTPNSRLEPRGAIWVQVKIDGQWANVFNTHFGLLRAERALQVKELLGPKWLRDPDLTGPRILCGDFNARPESPVCRALAMELRDVQAGHDVWVPRSTFFGRLPVFRIDHIFVDRDVQVNEVHVPSTRLTRTASDHLPLIADIVLPVHGTARTPAPAIRDHVSAEPASSG